MMPESDPLPIKIVLAINDILYKKSLIAFLKEDSNFLVIEEVKNGKTAVALAKKLNPDVIIMDLNLPVMSGEEALRKIKEYKLSARIIVLTALESKAEAIESLEAGANAYVKKDTNMKDLKMIIETVNKGAIWVSSYIHKKIH